MYAMVSDALGCVSCLLEKVGKWASNHVKRPTCNLCLLNINQMETILYKKNYHRHENKELPHIHEKQIRTVMDFK